MSKALKCDLCGKYYDFYKADLCEEGIEKEPAEYEYATGISFLHTRNNTNFMSGSIKDLCPECMDSIIKLIKDIRKGAQNEQ